MNITRKLSMISVFAVFQAVSLAGCSVKNAGLDVQPGGRSLQAITVQTRSVDQEKLEAYRDGRISNVFALAVNTEGIRRANFAVEQHGQIVLRSSQPADGCFLASADR